MENNKRVDKSATVISDNFKAYGLLPYIGYNHQVIDHSKGEYVNGKIHTNTIEGFWSHFKRTIIGTYHNISPKHLNAYCNESAYRYNNRNVTDPQRFKQSLKGAEGKRIKYEELTSNE